MAFPQLQAGEFTMARPKINMDPVAHGAAPSVLTELTDAIIGFRRSPYFLCHCAILAAFLWLGLGAAFLNWGISQDSHILVRAGLVWFMLSFAIWAGLGVAVLWMLGSLVSVVVREMWRQR